MLKCLITKINKQQMPGLPLFGRETEGEANKYHGNKKKQYDKTKI